MSEQLQDASPPEVQAKAASMGWIAPEHYRGDPERFITAEEYIRRGEEVIPIIRANAKKLEDKLEEALSKNAALEASLREINANMAEFTKAQRETMKERLEAQRRELLAERKQAREEGDDTRLDEVEEQLDANRAKRSALDSAPEGKAAPNAGGDTPPAPTPEQLARFESWRNQNPWYGRDDDEGAMLTALSYRFAQQALKAGKQGEAFFAFVDEKMAPHLRRSPAIDKTEGGGRGSSNGGGGGSKGYAALPADARAQCDADERRFVGPNKVFTTQKAWRDHFAAQYFGE